ALIPPTFVPLTQVVSLSSIGPRFNIKSLPVQLSGTLKVLLNQTTPSKSSNPAASQFVGRFIGFQLVAAKDGSDQFGIAADPGSLPFHQSLTAFSKSKPPFLVSATVLVKFATAGLKSDIVDRASALVQASATVPPHDE